MLAIGYDLDRHGPGLWAPVGPCKGVRVQRHLYQRWSIAALADDKAISPGIADALGGARNRDPPRSVPDRDNGE